MTTALLEKHKTKMPEAAYAQTEGIEFLWTVDAFDKAADVGVFGYDTRLELIQGRIFEIVGQGPRHSTLASQIADMLREAAQKQFAVREEKPFQIALDGEPIPDIMLLNGRQLDYYDRLPGPEDVRLLIEVSSTTAAFDLGTKSLLYAQAGIGDYWVVVVKENAIVVHRDPSSEGYQSIATLSGPDMLSPLVMPEVAWTITELLGVPKTPEEN